MNGSPLFEPNSLFNDNQMCCRQSLILRLAKKSPCCCCWQLCSHHSFLSKNLSNFNVVPAQSTYIKPHSLDFDNNYGRKLHQSLPSLKVLNNKVSRSARHSTMAELISLARASIQLDLNEPPFGRSSCSDGHCTISISSTTVCFDLL